MKKYTFVSMVCQRNPCHWRRECESNPRKKWK